MSDRKLQDALSNLDGTAASIQLAASYMMKHYNTAPVAVSEWRNALYNARTDQMLPLLYVVNEVLQTSKRNRGNKFLEAFAESLTDSLKYLAGKQGMDVEKIRRTVKIWGDRRVFSVRYINAVLRELEPYRRQQQQQQEPPPFSPPPEKPKPAATPDSEKPAQDDDIMDLLESHGKDQDDEEEEDEDDDIFATSNSQPRLEIDVNVDDVVVNSPVRQKKKRRRSANGRASSVLSNSNLLEMWNVLSENQQQCLMIENNIKKLKAKKNSEGLTDLVGDELQLTARQTNKDIENLKKYRRQLHQLANQRYQIQQDSIKYLNWLETSLRADQEDMNFCDLLETKIVQFADIHGVVQTARAKRRLQEEKTAKQKEYEERKRKKELEDEQFRQAALARNTEEQPGMIWNPTTREYQALNTDESWRD